MIAALLFSGSGDEFQRHAGGALQMSQSSVKVAVDKSINLLHKHFVPQYIQLPKRGEAIDEAFLYHNWGFPMIGWGAIDGTHITLLTPSTKKRKGAINRHGSPSLSTTILAGPSGRIYAAIANCQGRSHDASILRFSGIWDLFENQGWKPFEGAVILGDTAYMTKQNWLATQFHDAVAAKDPIKAKYNRHFKRCRTTVEQVRNISSTPLSVGRLNIRESHCCCGAQGGIGKFSIFAYCYTLALPTVKILSFQEVYLVASGCIITKPRAESYSSHFREWLGELLLEPPPLCRSTLILYHFLAACCHISLSFCTNLNQVATVR